MDALPRALAHGGLISVIIPIYNEQAVLPQLVQRLLPIMQYVAHPFELILVDDGSTDQSRAMLIQYAQQYASIKAVLLSRNFGKEAALTAGLHHCSGDAVIVLDADLQDPPELIPSMVKAWREGAEVVRMTRRSRAGESGFKRLSAYVYYRLLSYLSDIAIPADTGDFRLMSRRAVDALLQLPERQRYMKGLFAWVGFKTVELRYDRDARAAGETKWGTWKLFSLAFEGITSFSIKPLRLTTWLGLVVALTGLSYGAWIIAKTLFFGEMVAGYPSLISLISVLGGFQLVAIGLVGEYVGKNYIESKGRPVFLVEQVVQQPQPRAVSLEVLQHAQ